jgi:hypothetical protein
MTAIKLQSHPLVNFLKLNTILSSITLKLEVEARLNNI